MRTVRRPSRGRGARRSSTTNTNPHLTLALSLTLTLTRTLTSYAARLDPLLDLQTQQGALYGGVRVVNGALHTQLASSVLPLSRTPTPNPNPNQARSTRCSSQGYSR